MREVEEQIQDNRQLGEETVEANGVEISRILPQLKQKLTGSQ